MDLNNSTCCPCRLCTMCSYDAEVFLKGLKKTVKAANNGVFDWRKLGVSMKPAERETTAGYAMPATFTVKAGAATIWNQPPNDWKFTPIQTSSFTPTASTVTFTFSTTGYSGNNTNYLILDNLQLL